MTFNVAEYNSLRTELIHHDRTCLTITGLLLAASTAIYGLVLNKQPHPNSLLIILSVIWFIGFLYIVEKRFSIKRIAYYILTEIEQYEEDFYWEAWCWSNRHKNQNKSHTSDSLQLSKVSPIYIELVLFIVTEVFNLLWILFKTSIIHKIQINTSSIQIDNSLMKISISSIKFDIPSIIVSFLMIGIFIIPIIFSINYVCEYRNFNKSKDHFESIAKKITSQRNEKKQKKTIKLSWL